MPQRASQKKNKGQQAQPLNMPQQMPIKQQMPI